jgi:parvulin-like peptidyl-prolyl isomerase
VFEEQTADALAFAKVLGPVDSSRVAVQKFYNDNPADFITSECVSHILVASQSLAVSIRAKIAAGADFAAMAKQYSTDTSSAVKGGDLGCNAPGGYVPPFEHVADSIKVGVVSQPVQSQFGWHVIKVTSRQTHSLDLATAVQIQQYLQQLNPVTAFLQANQPKVHVNPAYGSWDPTQHVVPPTPPAANSGVPTTTAAPSALTP